jgi:hypothetical protein
MVLVMTRTYPIDHHVVLLREVEPDLYEQREEHWLRLRETSGSPDDLDPRPARELVSSVSTGRRFKRVRQVTWAALEVDPSLGTKKQGEMFSFFAPDFSEHFFVQVVGEPVDVEQVGVGFSQTHIPVTC